MDRDTEQGEPLRLTASDGASLAARRFRTPAAPRARIVVAAATGVSQRLYRRFSLFAAERGFETLSFDYRGLGGSRPASLSGYQADMLDWVKDFDAAVAEVPEDGLPLFAVTHSYGGHAVGLMERPERLSAAWMAGLGTGSPVHMSPTEARRARAFWRLFSPPVVALYGYLPLKLFGMGEEGLPRGVYQDWKRWCATELFYLGEHPEFYARCARLRAPLCAVNALDDPWATVASREAFVGAAFVGADKTTIDVDPADYGGHVGHMGYFKPNAAPLWEAALAFFEAAA